MAELRVQTRHILGKKVKILRKEGSIPAELYGHGIKNLHLTLPAKEFQKIFKEAGESTIINLKTDDDKTLPVMIHDIKTDPISEKILHIDFYQVKMSEKIRVHIPIEFIGEAPAVKNFGGILIKTLQEIEVEALPQDLPHRIQISLTPLDEIGKNISVRDLELSDKVKIFLGPETIIATVIETKAEEVEETTPAEAIAGETPVADTATQAENQTHGSVSPKPEAPRKQ